MPMQYLMRGLFFKERVPHNMVIFESKDSCMFTSYTTKGDFCEGVTMSVCWVRFDLLKAV